MLNHIKSVLPTTFPLATGTRQIITFSPRRSGQHVVIDWICRNSSCAIHFNNCTVTQKYLLRYVRPITYRVVQWQNGNKDDTGLQIKEHYMRKLKELEKSNNPLLVYSFEDWFPWDVRVKHTNLYKNHRRVIVLRDVYNWLASSLAHSGGANINIGDRAKEYKEICELIILNVDSLFFINYNRFITEPEYREKIATDLSLDHFHDNNIKSAPNFGGGSSFTGLKGEDDNSTYLNRWKLLIGNSDAIELLADRRLQELNKLIFGNDHYLEILNK